MKKPEGFGKKISDRQKGKTFEDRFGIEKANEIKTKMSKNASKTWVEKFDSGTLKNMKKMASLRMQKYNKDRIWSKEKAIKIIKKYVKNNKEVRKNDFWKPKNKNIPSARVIEKIFGSLDAMANEVGFVFYKHNRKEYLKKNPEILKKIITNNVMFQKGKKYEERYDDKTTKKIKNILSKNMLKRFETEEVWNKGLTGVQKAWNKNLTKEDHEGIRQMSKARIEYMKRNKGNFVSTHELKIQDFLIKQNIEFEPQYYVKDIEDRYLADIYIKKSNLIIEIDGVYWHSQDGRQELDEKRTNQMIKKGYKVLRFTDKKIEENQKYVEDKILSAIKNGN